MHQLAYLLRSSQLATREGMHPQTGLRDLSSSDRSCRNTSLSLGATDRRFFSDMLLSKKENNFFITLGTIFLPERKFALKDKHLNL